ncbi:extracellular solute-binding protein [Streptomyces sp. FIT100]|uniref:extracellular solute-binding protein n=1 Tax=Streptomyces sp. FIT100 TaxID=2837956 RepID=UPI0021C789A3|nr:extracellular solute-binding protein [Streptomyces sp. FIT100]UUN30630.1 extracellular solute-binding protein [Streptomyces sp. FIT100]
MSSGLSRRSVLRSIGIGTALAATGVPLSACSSSGGSGGSLGNVGKDLAPWPAYVPHPDAPRPELASNDKGVQPGFLSYPKELKQSVAEKPGDGSKVTVWTITWGAPPSAKDKHKLWQALNKELGVDLDLKVVPAMEVSQKYAALVAGGELPDIIAVSQNLPNPTELLAAKCQDLTEFLSGDAVKEYPNLAAIPAYAWKAAGRIGGRLYRVPAERSRIGHSYYANQGRLKQAGIWVPKVGGIAADDLTKGLRQITGRNKFAFAADPAGAYGFNSVIPVHGTPNQWALKDGQFLPSMDTDEFKAGLEQMAKWWKAGVYKPQVVQGGTDFQSGVIALNPNSQASFSGLATQIKDGFTLDTLRPFQPSNGGRPGHWFSPGADYFTALKKASKDRIKLMLRILDFLAAPFGTKEWELIQYGVEGTHFERGADGSPVQNEFALNGDNHGTLGLTYLCGPQQVLFLPGSLPGAAETVKRRHAFQTEIAEVGVADPSVGLLSKTFNTKLSELQVVREDAIKAIVAGRKPLSEWDTTVKDWKSKGGDQAAEEYAKEYEAAQKA